MRKWIARFSFSLLIIGGVLIYEAFELQKSGTPAWQLLLITIGGALAIAMGASGIRYRHEMMRRN